VLSEIRILITLLIHLSFVYVVFTVCKPRYIKGFWVEMTIFYCLRISTYRHAVECIQNFSNFSFIRVPRGIPWTLKVKIYDFSDALTHERTSFISRLSTISNRKLSVMGVTVWY
jgi:hypothetical protein